MFLGETFNISGAKIGRGCTISRYTSEPFLLKDAKRTGATSDSAEVWILPVAGTGRGVPVAEESQDRRRG